MPSREARFGAIYDAHNRTVLAYCRRRARIDEVEDLAAEVFATIWRKIDQAPEDNALPWIYRIAYLVFSNHWRSLGRKRRLESKLQGLGVTVPDDLDDQVIIRHELREVLEAAAMLRPSEQEILRLALWEHLSHAEIGVVLDIDPNAAKQRLFRARQKLIKEHERVARKTENSPAAQEGGER